MHEIDWNGTYNLIHDFLKELPEGKAPVLISYSDPDEDYKTVQQYEIARQESEGLVYDVIDTICAQQKTRWAKPIRCASYVSDIGSAICRPSITIFIYTHDRNRRWFNLKKQVIISNLHNYIELT